MTATFRRRLTTPRAKQRHTYEKLIRSAAQILTQPIWKNTSAARTSTNPPTAKINSRPPPASSDAFTAVTPAGSVNLEGFDGVEGITLGPLVPALYRLDLHIISMWVVRENYKKSGKPSPEKAWNRAGFAVPGNPLFL
jgi:hypothetical protein